MFSMLPHPIGFLKLVLNVFCISNNQGGRTSDVILMKCMFNIVICQDTCKPICFELFMMRNTHKLYSLNDLMFTQSHRGTDKLELVLSLCCRAV